MGDLALLLVVERQPERIPEGHQRPLHGVGFRFLEGGFMGLAQVGVDAVAGAAALADQRRLAGGAGADGDPHPGGVGDTPAGPAPALAPGPIGRSAWLTQRSCDGFPLPAVKAKDAVGFCDHLPALQVADLGCGPARAGAPWRDRGGRRGQAICSVEKVQVMAVEGMSGMRDRNQWAEV